MKTSFSTDEMTTPQKQANNSAASANKTPSATSAAVTVVTPSPRLVASEEDFRKEPDGTIMSALPQSELIQLYRLLGIATGGSDAEAVAKFLADMGTTSLKDLAFFEKDDFAMTRLSPILQRKLERIAIFVSLTKTSLLKVSSMEEILEGLENVEERNTKAVKDRDQKEEDSGNIPAVIKLDVGGQTFTTTQKTLCSVPGTFLESMFSGRHSSPALTENGYFIIDRNGTYFRYILDYLRIGFTASLPPDDDGKRALAMEADYYGLDELALACRAPMIDIWECLPEDVQKYRAKEDDLRAEIITRKKNKSAAAGLELHKGLISLFCADESFEPVPLKYQPDNRSSLEGAMLMNRVRKQPSTGVDVTVKTLEEFRGNFNREHANILHRLSDILVQEPVIVAGGSVLNALTSSKGLRTSKWWGKKSDIDLFVHCNNVVESTRIARRIFYALSADHEQWVILRSRGVITMHNCSGGFIEEKIQVVLRLYDSPAEVLFGFDCDCCCCAYDGRNIWVSPRWVRALRTRYNILNPLHAWPNRASYELRLAKYATRGFAVFVPGLETKRVNVEKISCNGMKELKGLARLLKIASDIDTVPGHLSEPVGLRSQSFRLLSTEDKSADERIISCQSGYDGGEDLNQILVPSCYFHGEAPSQVDWYYGDFPIASQCRDEAWEQIENAPSGDEGIHIPETVSAKLVDAWEFHKRSREYMNSLSDKHELDNHYYRQGLYEE